MNKRILISEEEKKSILSQHASKGTSISENIKESYFEEEEYEDLEEELDEESDEELGEAIEDDIPFEPSPRGMRSARSRADFQPAGSREVELGSGVFGKYSEDVPPIVIRYMRKNPRMIIKRLYDIYGDKMMEYIEDAQNK